MVYDAVQRDGIESLLMVVYNKVDIVLTRWQGEFSVGSQLYVWLV